jgi:hypothetical protein
MKKTDFKLKSLNRCFYEFSDFAFSVFLEHTESVLVGDHAFVGALHFVQEGDVDVGSRALLEASWEYHSVEQFVIGSNATEILRSGSEARCHH